MKRACVFMANGTEECEALLTVDILRRAGVEVVTASVNQKPEILSSHNVRMDTDAIAADIQAADFDLVMLPGGMPGTLNLKENDFVKPSAPLPAHWPPSACWRAKRPLPIPPSPTSWPVPPWSRNLWWRTATSSPAGGWALPFPSLWHWCGGSAVRTLPKRYVRPLVTPTASNQNIRLSARASHTAHAFSSLCPVYCGFIRPPAHTVFYSAGAIPASAKEVCP